MGMAAAYDFKLTLLFLCLLTGGLAAYQHFGSAKPGAQKVPVGLGG